MDHVTLDALTLREFLDLIERLGWALAGLLVAILSALIGLGWRTLVYFHKILTDVALLRQSSAQIEKDLKTEHSANREGRKLLHERINTLEEKIDSNGRKLPPRRRWW